MVKVTTSESTPRRLGRWVIALVATLTFGAALAQTYNEAPSLAERVAAGELPPVAERLPDDPLVIDVVEEIGTYGGTLRRAFIGPADANNYVRVVYDSLVRFSSDGSEIVPHIVASWEASDDFHTWTLRLRPGAKWSDGEPFTADALMFWYEAVLLNEELTPAVPTWVQNSDGSPVTMERVDDYTVSYTFDFPNTLFLTELTFRDGADRTIAAFLPGHYMSQFHPDYADAGELEQMVADAGLSSWTELFQAKSLPVDNAERPTMAAWVPFESTVSDQVFTLRRNPYYIGVDPEGKSAPLHRRGAVPLFRGRRGAQLRGGGRRVGLSGPPHPDDELPRARGERRPLELPRDHLALLRRERRRRVVQPGVPHRRSFGRTPRHAGLPRRPVARHQPRRNPRVRLSRPRRDPPAGARPVAPVLPGRRIRPDVHRVRPRIGEPECSTTSAWSATPRANAPCPTAALFGSRSPWSRPLAPGPTWPSSWRPTGRRWASPPTSKVRERNAHFTMRDSNELQVEIWNEDTTAFPFTGNPKADPRSNPATIFAVESRTWYETDGARGSEPAPGIAQDRRDHRHGEDGGRRRADCARQGALPAHRHRSLRAGHGRPHADDPGRGGGQRRPPQRP